MSLQPTLKLPAPVAEHASWVADGVALVETMAEFPSAHALLVTDGDQTVLLDVGLSEDQLAGLAPLLDQVVVTHFHYDHVIGWPLLDDLDDPPELVINGQEMPAFRDEDVPGFLGLQGDAIEVFQTQLAPLYPSFGVDFDTFQPGQDLELAGTRWQTVPVPGHSPGHCLFWAPEPGVLFSVDIEFSGLGPWYAWPHCNPDAFEASVEEARGLFEQARVVVTSHSEPIVEDPERALGELDAFQAHYEERDEAVFEALDARKEDGATVEELVEDVRIFYGEYLEADPQLAYWCAIMTRKHLERLAQDGRIEQDGQRWRSLDG